MSATSHPMSVVHRLAFGFMLVSLCLCSLINSGCGGGGGGGSSTLVTVGSVTFDPATSTDFTRFETSFPPGSDWVWLYTTEAMTTYTVTQDFYTDTLTISGKTLPVMKVANTTTEGPYDSYGYWAVSTTGELYCLTSGTKGHLPVGDPHVLASQPRLVSRYDYTVSQSWTNGVPALSSSRNDPTWTRQVVSTNATSPAGFTNCVQVRITLPGGHVSGMETIDEYWQDGAGCVEVYETKVGGGAGETFVRQGIAFSG